MRKFEVGDRVKIISLSKSRIYGIEEEMKRMLKSNGYHKITRIGSNSVHINGFFFSKDDIQHIEEKEPEPVIFHYDATTLEV